MTDAPARWLVYGVVSLAEAGEAQPRELPLRGAFGQRLTMLQSPPLGAIVGELPTSGSLAQPATADLLAFGKVIAYVHAQQTIVPLRFGGVLSDEVAVRRHLADNVAGYQQLLDRLRDTEELAVRLTGDEQPALTTTPGPAASEKPAGSGTAYLRALQARHAQADKRQAIAKGRADWLRAALLPHVLAHHLELIEEGDKLTIAAAFLVRRGQAAELRQKCAN